MKNWIFLFLCMVLMSGPVHSGGDRGRVNNNVHAGADSASNSMAKSSSVSESASASQATASGGSGGGATQSQSLISIGSAQAQSSDNNKSIQSQAQANGSGDTIGDVLSPTTNVNVVTENPDDIKIKNTPDIMAPFANSTSPCRIAGSGGLSLPGIGVSGGGSVEDEECTLRQTAQTFGTLGVPAMGMWLLCRSEVMERVGSDSSACDAMIAQWQIEASLEAPDLGKLDSSLLLASASEGDYEEQRAKQEALSREIDTLEEQLARERRARRSIEQSIDEYRIRDMERRRQVLEMLKEEDGANG